jgi:hypothetical protein
VLQECVHALLLKFVDAPGMPASITSDAMALLALLPTQPSLTQRLVAALDSAGGAAVRKHTALFA